MELELNQADTLRKVSRSETSTRTLRIERTGDFWRGKVTPKIRLTGQWLERAGFKPGHRVEVCLNEPGKLTLSFVAKSAASETPIL